MENIQGIKWCQKISILATPLWEISEIQCAKLEPGCQFQPPYPLGYADTALWSQYVGGISENMCRENAGKKKGFRRSESVCQTQLVTVPWHPGVEWYVVYPIMLSSEREISFVDVSQSVSQKKVHCILCTPLAKIFARAAKTGRRSRGFHDFKKFLSISDKACKIQTNSGSFFIFSSIFDFSDALCDEASKVQ